MTLDPKIALRLQFLTREYVEAPSVLDSALQAGHESVPALTKAANNLIAKIERRGWI